MRKINIAMILAEENILMKINNSVLSIIVHFRGENNLEK